MVRERWYVILEGRELPRRGPLGLTRLGQRLVVWRDDQGTLRCVGADCPHRGADLALGIVVEGCIECPFHGFRFDGAGRCTHLPAHGPEGPIPPKMRSPAFPVREAHGFVWLWFGAPRPELPPLPWFEDLDGRYAWSGFADDWSTHYTRAVENQLDFTHLPFAHRTSIGKGVPHRLGVLTEVEGDRLLVRYDPAFHDAGGFFVEFIAPNLWRNRLADKVCALMAFVPVDAHHTRIYVRFYQAWLTLPVLGWLVCRASNLFNAYVLAQDKRIVLTQEPRETALRMGEVLIPSDQPIIAWRRWRQRLLDAQAEGAEPPPTTP